MLERTYRKEVLKSNNIHSEKKLSSPEEMASCQPRGNFDFMDPHSEEVVRDEAHAKTTSDTPLIPIRTSTAINMSGHNTADYDFLTATPLAEEIPCAEAKAEAGAKTNANTNSAVKLDIVESMHVTDADSFDDTEDTYDFDLPNHRFSLYKGSSLTPIQGSSKLRGSGKLKKMQDPRRDGWWSRYVNRAFWGGKKTRSKQMERKAINAERRNVVIDRSWSRE